MIGGAFVVDCHILTLSFHIWGHAVKESVLEMVWHHGYVVSNIFVEWNPHDILLWLKSWEPCSLCINFFTLVNLIQIILFFATHHC